MIVTMLGAEAQFDRLMLRVQFDPEVSGVEPIVKDSVFDSAADTRLIQTHLKGEAVRIATLYTKIGAIKPLEGKELDMTAADLAAKKA